MLLFGNYHYMIFMFLNQDIKTKLKKKNKLSTLLKMIETTVVVMLIDVEKNENVDLMQLTV